VKFTDYGPLPYVTLKWVFIASGWPALRLWEKSSRNGSQLEK